MALISTVTDAGTALNATALQTGVDSGVTRVEIGTGNVTTAALARAVTAIQTPFTPVRESVDPPVFVAGPTGQVTFFDNTSGSYDYNELAVFVGSTCIYYECDDAGAAIGSKASDSALQKSVALVYSNGDASLVAREYVIMPMATVDNFGLVQYASDPQTNATMVLTPLQIRTLIAGVSAGLTEAEINQLIADWWATNPDVPAGNLTGTIAFQRLDRAEANDMNLDTTNVQELVTPRRVRDYVDNKIISYTALPAAIPPNGTIEIVREA